MVLINALGYARMMLALLPPGRAWEISPGNFIYQLFLGTADEASRVDARAVDLLDEVNPSQCSELLPDYERVLGLSSDGTEAARVAAVVARFTQRQRFRPIDFQVALAAILGQDAENVVVIERTRSFAIQVSDDEEIYRFFIYRDPLLPGSYDLTKAQAQIDKMKPAHTMGYVIESTNMLCDDPYSLCDRDLLGA